MKIVIVATKTCNHRPMLERRLQAMGVPYSVEYVDDHPELIERYDVQRSPNLVVNDQVVFRPSPTRSLPTETELDGYLKLNND